MARLVVALALLLTLGRALLPDANGPSPARAVAQGLHLPRPGHSECAHTPRHPCLHARPAAGHLPASRPGDS